MHVNAIYSDLFRFREHYKNDINKFVNFWRNNNINKEIINHKDKFV